LGGEVKRPEDLLCYDYQNGIIDEAKDIIFAIKLELFSIGIISLPEIIQSMKTIDVGIMDIDMKTSISKQGSEVHSTKKKIPSNRFEPEVALEDKVYPKMYYRH
jgi:hypothetical protein